jgi:drug/metabolite transporter (DMT)-like permease
MAGSIASFSSIAIAVRELNGLHDVFEIMIARSAVGLIIVLAALVITGRYSEVRCNKLGVHFSRNIVHFIGQSLWILALTTIPLAQVFALEFTAPIWVLILSPILLREKITRLKVVTSLLGFAGILIVVHPEVGEPNLGLAAAVGCAFCFALAHMMTKILGQQEAVISILFWLTLIQLFVGVAAVFWDGVVRLPTAESFPWLVLIGVAGLLGHFCLTRALYIATATYVLTIDFARLPVILIAGMMLYDESIDLAVLIGAAVIFAANYINVCSATRQKDSLKCK